MTGLCREKNNRSRELLDFHHQIYGKTVEGEKYVIYFEKVAHVSPFSPFGTYVLSPPPHFSKRLFKKSLGELALLSSAPPSVSSNLSHSWSAPPALPRDVRACSRVPLPPPQHIFAGWGLFQPFLRVAGWHGEG